VAAPGGRLRSRPAAVRGSVWRRRYRRGRGRGRPAGTAGGPAARPSRVVEPAGGPGRARLGGPGRARLGGVARRLPAAAVTVPGRPRRV
jgi:hypothetical protein